MTNSIEEIKARWLKATPGPWSADCQPGDCVVWGPSKIEQNSAHHIKEVFLCNVDNGEVNPVAYDLEKENAEAIAHAPDDIVFLLTQIDRANEKVAQSRRLCAELLRDEAKRLEVMKASGETIQGYQDAANFLEMLDFEV